MGLNKNQWLKVEDWPIQIRNQIKKKFDSECDNTVEQTSMGGW